MDDDPSKLPPLVRRMLEPDFYPHPTAGRIDLVQTHISYVLLTGELAYKVKKPVNLGFVDFTTLERRRHFCGEEVRLNCRGAPGIYLQVEPIRGGSGGLRMGGDGPPVEYAVKMRQFPQDGLFSRMLARGRLGPEHIEALARTVAAYHATCPTDDHIAGYGAPDRIGQVTRDNYTYTEKFVGSLQSREQFEQIRAFIDRFLGESRQLLEDRVSTGHVRECHGDLHLGNVCQWAERILLFDCIEFNESFRCTDVVQDAAFGAMDLEAAGRADLSSLLINMYSERTGDWEGLQLLRFYLCRYAYVRALVNSLLLDEPDVAAEAKEVARRRATDYYHLAWAYSRPRRGRLILVSGLSGAGKSTLARHLSQQFVALHIRSDAVRKHLAGILLDQKGEQSLYTPEVTARTYARLLDLGLRLARYGFPVILDAKYDKRDVRREALRRAAADAVPVRILHCVAPRAVLRDRLASRGPDISDAGPELLDHQEREAEPFDATRSARTSPSSIRPGRAH